VESGDATRRTRLATERTQLAWWRTGLAALAVGIGIGRVVPELSDPNHQWPYVVLGVAFCLYGVALFVYGNRRGHEVDEAVARGGFAAIDRRADTALAIGGIVLGLATSALILLG
jgi:inner membrane protein YidH